MHGFIAYGLRVRSDLRIPGGLPDTGAADEADIEIVLAPPCAAQSDLIYRFEGAALCFTAPGVAEYRCDAANIRVTPHPDASEAAVAELLIATAFPALLWMRGGFVLHAAAAQLAGSDAAIAVAGGSCSGKSTVLAQLVEAGAAVVGDDTIRLDTAGHAGEAAGLAGGYFLRGADGAARSYHSVPPDRARRAAPLAAILVLSRSDADAPGALRRLAPVEAVAQLLAHRHRPRVPALLGRHAATLADSALLAGTIPIYSWQRLAGSPELAAWEWVALARCARGQGG